MSDKFTRRAFLGYATAAASAAVVGCERRPLAPFVRQAAVATTDLTIVRAAVYPGIGVARIGNSTADDGFFVGPEVTEPSLTRAGESRDDAGAIKRQAARFRVYGYNAAGELVGEITAANATIEWQVHLANKKPAWYRFLAALDIPESATLSSPRRNAGVTGEDRAGLAIDPGARSISGSSLAGADYRFDGGAFMGTPVSLGELRTDDAGRLLVLGALGKSASPMGKPVFDTGDGDTFNNADGWYDDIADGPVDAKVTLDGRDIPVEPSWVVVAPPNYAPDVIGWRTLHDLLVDTYIAAGMLSAPEGTSFTHDVLPALRRLTNLQWVNQGFAQKFGAGTALDFDDPTLVRTLCTKAPPGADDLHAEMRRSLHQSFRPQTTDKTSWPWIYGDAFGTADGATSPRVALACSEPPRRAPRAMGRRRLHRRLGSGRGAAPLDRRRAARRTAGDARPRRAPLLSRGRVPSRLRDDVADAARDDVRGAVSHQASRRRRGGARLRRPAHAGSRDRRKRPALRAGPRRPDQVDGAPVARGHRLLPLRLRPSDRPRLRPAVRSALADVLAGTRAEPGAHRGRLQGCDRHDALARSAGGGVQESATVGARDDGQGAGSDAPDDRRLRQDGRRRGARAGVVGDPELPAVMLVESLAVATSTAIAAASVDEERAERPRTKSPLERGGWESLEQLEEFRRLLGLG